jgi:hypothetical protein
MQQQLNKMLFVCYIRRLERTCSDPKVRKNANYFHFFPGFFLDSLATLLNVTKVSKFVPSGLKMQDPWGLLATAHPFDYFVANIIEG